jgi:hypothetical protein
MQWASHRGPGRTLTFRAGSGCDTKRLPRGPCLFVLLFHGVFDVEVLDE